MTIKFNYQDLELLDLEQHFLTRILQLIEKYDDVFTNQDQDEDANLNAWLFCKNIKQILSDFHKGIREHELADCMIRHLSNGDSVLVLIEMLRTYFDRIENRYDEYKYINPEEAIAGDESQPRIFPYDRFFNEYLVGFIQIILNKSVVNQMPAEDKALILLQFAQDMIIPHYGKKDLIKIQIKLAYIESMLQQFLPSKAAILLEAEQNIKQLIKQYNLNISPILFSDGLHNKYRIFPGNIAKNLTNIISIFDMRGLFVSNSANMCSLLGKMLLLATPVIFSDKNIFIIPEDLTLEGKKTYLLEKFQGDNIEQFLIRNLTLDFIQQSKLDSIFKTIINLPVDGDRENKARKDLLKLFLICCGDREDVFNALFGVNAAKLFETTTKEYTTGVTKNITAQELRRQRSNRIDDLVKTFGSLCAKLNEHTEQGVPGDTEHEDIEEYKKDSPGQ